MGQCLAKRKKNREESHAERYKPTTSESQQPIVNGGQNTEAHLSASNSSLLEKKGTQHISDRERGEEHILEEHPADNPNLQPLFDESSTKKLMRRVSQYDNRMLDSSPLQGNKYNSCSTLMVNETVSQPNMKNTIKAVALAIYYLIKNPRPKSHYSSHDDIELDLELQRNLEVFDEGKHPLTGSVSDDYSFKHPEHRHVYRFIRTLFSQAQLNAECAIVTLVYLERLLTYAQFELTPANWKRCTLGAIMLASKVWDDQAVWNIDFCQIFKEVTVEDMNALERQFLQILQFNTNVPPSIYANYYFNLRSLAQKNELSLSLEPLSKEQAVRLEALSNLFKDRLAGSTNNLKRASSLHSMNRSSKVIIS